MNIRLIFVLLALALLARFVPADADMAEQLAQPVDAVCSTDTDCGCTDDCLES